MTAAPPPILLVEHLERDHLARPITVTTYGRDGKARSDTRYEITPEGQEMLRQNQLTRGRFFREHPDAAVAATRDALRAQVPTGKAKR